MKVRDLACLLLVFASLPSLLLLVSCGKSASPSIPIGERELPDMELHNASYVLGQTSEKPISVKANLMTVYGAGRDTELEGVTFRQGKTLSGTCDRAEVSSDNNHARLSGNVSISKTDEENDVTIYCQDIVWNGEEKTLLCEGEVTVIYEDGTKIRATGFSADTDKNIYEFGKLLQGEIAQ